MPSELLLHERDDFKALVETAADSEKINDPALVEKDYWIMHAVFGLKQNQGDSSSTSCATKSKFLESSRWNETRHTTTRL